MTGIKQKGERDKERERLTHPRQAEQTAPPLSLIFFCTFLLVFLHRPLLSHFLMTEPVKPHIRDKVHTHNKRHGDRVLVSAHFLIHSPSRPVTPSCTDGCSGCFLSVTWQHWRMHTEGCQWPRTHTHIHTHVQNHPRLIQTRTTYSTWHTHLQHTCHTLQCLSLIWVMWKERERESPWPSALCSAEDAAAAVSSSPPSHLSRHVSLSVTPAPCSHFCPSPPFKNPLFCQIWMPPLLQSSRRGLIPLPHLKMCCERCTSHTFLPPHFLFPLFTPQPANPKHTPLPSILASPSSLHVPLPPPSPPCLYSCCVSYVTGEGSSSCQFCCMAAVSQASSSSVPSSLLALRRPS